MRRLSTFVARSALVIAPPAMAAPPPLDGEVLVAHNACPRPVSDYCTANATTGTTSHPIR
jgi:hypothetical protein